MKDSYVGPYQIRAIRFGEDADSKPIAEQCGDHEADVFGVYAPECSSGRAGGLVLHQWVKDFGSRAAAEAWARSLMAAQSRAGPSSSRR
jgi:hypothetical protein